MIRQGLKYWFRHQIRKVGKEKLLKRFTEDEVEGILKGYWKRYKGLKDGVPNVPTMGGKLMVDLAAISHAFYDELRERGLDEKETIDRFFEIAWPIYRKMGGLSWKLAGWNKKNNYEHLKRATVLFRKFPFNPPSYQWKDVEAGNKVVGFDCLKCPVADYFKANDLGGFCKHTWCALDFPLAKEWNSELERKDSIAGGADKCDFRWKAK